MKGLVGAATRLMPLMMLVFLTLATVQLLLAAAPVARSQPCCHCSPG